MWVSKERYDNLVDERHAAFKEVREIHYKNSSLTCKVARLEDEIKRIQFQRKLGAKNYRILGLESGALWNITAVGYKCGTCLSAGGEHTRFFDAEDNTIFEATEALNIEVLEE